MNFRLRIADCGLRIERHLAPASYNPQSAIRNPQWVQFAIAAALLLPVLAAGEAPAPPPPTAPPAAPPVDTTKLTLSDNFEFKDDNRRDPFSYFKPGTVDIPPEGTEPNSPLAIPQQDIQHKKEEVEAALADAERALMNSDSSSAIGRCDAGLQIFRDVPQLVEIEKEGFAALRERLYRLRKAADQMRTRQIAEVEFKNMNLRITGVVAKAKNPQAIINSKIVKKGDMVASGSDNAAVIVEDILPDQIVFLYRGYKMSLEIGR